MIPYELAVLVEVIGEIKFNTLAEAVDKSGQNWEEVMQILMRYTVDE